MASQVHVSFPHHVVRTECRRRSGRNRTATVPGKMPTGADKKDQDHDHWRKREAEWAGWGVQKASDKKMADTKEKRDDAREVHEANQKKREEDLEATSSTPHVTERQEEGSLGNRAKTTAAAIPEDNRLEAMDVDGVGGDVGGDFGGDGSNDDGGSGGGSCSGGSSGSDRGTWNGGGPVRKVAYKQRPKLYASTKIIARLVEPWQDGSREWMERKRESGGEKAQERDGTLSRAANEPRGNTSIPVMVKLLGDGLCTDQGKGDIEISDGVYYKRAELRNLQYYYDKSYVLDPQNIWVVFGQTRVKIDGGVHVVKSVDHGKYTLEGRESTITQWELLEKRCDEGVTLYTDLRRFILHLVTKYTVMMGSVVPALTGVLTVMLWNPNDAVANKCGDDTDPESNMKTSELMSIKERVDTLRDLSKLLTCAYRSGRPGNLLEAYQPCTLQECKLLQEHHSQWSANITHSLKSLSVRDTRSANVSDSELGGDMSYALRFALARCKTFVHNMPPVVVVGCGIRDAAKYGRVGLHSLDTTFFSHARFGPRLLEHVLGADSSHGAVQKTLDHCHSFFQNARNLRKHVGAYTNGGVGDGIKLRKQRVPLVEDTPEAREEAMDMFMGAMSANGCQRVMEAVETIDPGFVERGLDRLTEAKTASTLFELDGIGGEEHLLGKTPEEVAEGEKSVVKLLQALEEDGIDSEDFVVFSVATHLAMLFNGATLRPQDFFGLTESAEESLSTVCMEHGVEGAELVRWLAVMALVGRPFLKKANGGELDTRFGPLGIDGKALSQGVFGTILEETGLAFFGLDNVDVNALRTAQVTLAVEYVIKLGFTLDAMCLDELAKETSGAKNVTLFPLTPHPPQNVTDIYNARRSDPVSATKKCKEGEVSFKGGIRRMLDERRGRLSGGSDTPSDISSTTDEDLDVHFIRVEKELKLRTKELELARVEDELRLRKSDAWFVAGPAVGAVPATGSYGAAPASGAAVSKQPKQGRRLYKKKTPRTTDEAKREGVKAMVKAIGEAFQRAKVRTEVNDKRDGVHHYMALPSNQASRFYLVRYLVKNDAEFAPGAWYVNSKHPTAKGSIAFDELVGLVQDQVEDFHWSSWRDM
ncbi:unnamed protein product [Ectocarpus sp. CCAP 1310/34]|nr:unnamed protein product [Ectocarpus sp. CCAP 1310/34]